jgi:hypothetical protein
VFSSHAQFYLQRFDEANLRSQLSRHSIAGILPS